MDFGIKQISIQNYPLLGLLSKYFVRNCFVLHAVQKAWATTKTRTKMNSSSHRQSSKKSRTKKMFTRQSFSECHTII